MASNAGHSLGYRGGSAGLRLVLQCGYLQSYTLVHNEQQLHQHSISITSISFLEWPYSELDLVKEILRQGSHIDVQGLLKRFRTIEEPDIQAQCEIGVYPVP